MGYQGRFSKGSQENPRNEKRGKGRTILFAVVVVVLLVVLAGIACAMVYYHQTVKRMNGLDLPAYGQTTQQETEGQQGTLAAASEPEEETAPPTQTTEATRPAMSADDIINILVVGQAAREGEESRMADTSIVVSLNTYTGEVTLFSVLRDTLVQPPDYRDVSGRLHTCGSIKFTSCYALGYSWGGKENGIVDAMAFTNATLMRNFGVEIDHNIEVSFDGFIKLIDYMDGIDIELTEAEADYLNKEDLWVTYDVAPGVQRLDGMAALCYARMRKAAGDSDSDIKRTSRQQKVISALLEKVRYMSIPDLQNVANTLLPLITTTMTPNDVAALLIKVLPLVRDLKISSHTIPVENETLTGSRWGDVIDIYEDGIPDSVLYFDAGKNKKFIRAITEAEGIE